jgi:hypothetical protein
VSESKAILHEKLRGRLKNGDTPGDFAKAERCGAKAGRGAPYTCPAMPTVDAGSMMALIPGSLKSPQTTGTAFKSLIAYTRIWAPRGDQVVRLAQ